MHAWQVFNYLPSPLVLGTVTNACYGRISSCQFAEYSLALALPYVYHIAEGTNPQLSGWVQTCQRTRHRWTDRHDLQLYRRRRRCSTAASDCLSPHQSCLAWEGAKKNQEHKSKRKEMKS